MIVCLNLNVACTTQSKLYLLNKRMVRARLQNILVRLKMDGLMMTFWRQRDDYRKACSPRMDTCRDNKTQGVEGGMLMQSDFPWVGANGWQ